MNSDRLLLWLSQNPLGRGEISGGGFKASETLLGIETQLATLLYKQLCSFKASETLLGIETNKLKHLPRDTLLQSL